MVVPFHTHTFELPVADAADMQTRVAHDKIVVPAMLGSAATADTGDFATAAQGVKAEMAVPGHRQIIVGSGLTGGGDLSNNLTIELTQSTQAAISRAAKAPSEDNEIKTGAYLIGGGTLGDEEITINLSSTAISAMQAAITAVQNSDLGALAKKDKVLVGDIQITGAPPSSTRFLRGDGKWEVPVGGGGGGGWNGGIIAEEVNNRSISAYRLSGGSSNASATILYKNETDFYILLTNAGERDGAYNNLRPFKINVASGRVSMNHGLDVTGGDIKVISGKIFVGNAEFQSNGNIVGSIWSNWGASNAYTAISNRIEARARLYHGQNLVINGDFRIDQRLKAGVNTLGFWGYDRWLNVAAGRQQYVENITAGTYALYWDGGGVGSLGNGASGTAPRQLSVGEGNLRIIVPFSAQNVCLIKLNGAEAPTFNPYTPRPFAEELALCQRYYQKSYPLGVAVSTASTTGVTLPITYGNTDTGAMKAHLHFPTRMARAPALSFYTISGTPGVRQLDEEGEALTTLAVSTSLVSETMSLIANTNIGNGASRFYQFNYEANAEITA